jgi:hypothetical protein
MDHALGLHSAERPGQQSHIEDVGVAGRGEVLEGHVSELDPLVRRLREPLLRPGDRVLERIDRRDVGSPIGVPPREAAVSASDLEDLKPVERAVFLLREVFEYGYPEIAEVVEKSEANCRQLFARARQRIEAGTPRFEASAGERDELARRFFAACTEGDMDGLLELLSADAVAVGDGGGKAYAARTPIHGAQRVATFLVRLFEQGTRIGARLELTQVNGYPGALAYDADGLLLTVFSLDVVEGRVQAIRSVVNPDKLRHLGPISPFGRPDPGDVS